MPPPQAPHLNDLLADLAARIHALLGDDLAGLYLYGSLVSGGFDDDVSDLDLLAATTGDPGPDLLERLRAMHDGFVRDHPRWDDRVEVAYLSLAALRTFKTRASPLAIISPGEPLHLIAAGPDWLMNWYLVRDHGVALLGPPPAEIIPRISKTEFIDAVRDHAAGAWFDRLRGRKQQSYAVLTLGRALYAHRFGEHVSKQAAAAWAQHTFPEWADLIQDALRWRATAGEPDDDPAASLPATVRYLEMIQAAIAVDRDVPGHRWGQAP